MMQRMKGTLRPGRKAGVLALAVLLLTCVLMAGAVSASDEATSVTDINALKKALEEGQTNIALAGNIVTDKEIVVEYAVIIDGNGHTISADDNFPADTHLLEIIKGPVTLENLTLDSDDKAKGLNIHQPGDEITLTNLTLTKSAGSGITINGAVVSASNLTISESAWNQSIDVGLSASPSVEGSTSTLTLSGTNDLQDIYQINSDNPGSVTVKGDGVDGYTIYDWYYWYTDKGTPMDYGNYKRTWTTNPNFATAVDIPKVQGSKAAVCVSNTEPNVYALHQDIGNATTFFETGDFVTQLQDIDVDAPITINKKITFNGGGKTLTLNTPEKSTSITVNDGATLENLNVVAAENANFYIGIQLNGGTLKESSIDLSEQTCDASARAVVISTGIVSGNTILAGNSDTSSSQCVVVSGSDVTVSGNTLTTGKSAAERDGKRTSGSVGIRLSSGASETTTITGNTIISTQGEGLNNGIAADGVKNDVTIDASGNTFVLDATKYGGAFYVNPTDGTTVTLDAEGNTVESAASFIYADNVEKATAYTISGKIENNDFAAADKGLVSADELTLTLKDLNQNGNSGLITDPSESLTVTPEESKITVTEADVSWDGENAIIAFTGYEIFITNATISDSDISIIYYNDDSTATVTHKTVRHMDSSTNIRVKLLITDMPKLAEISTPKATIGDAEKARLAAQKITPLSVVDIHHESEPGFDRITLTISGLAPSDKIIGFHVGASGVDTSEVTTQDGNHVVTFTDLTSASPFGIGVISDGPQPPSSSSGGNMDNAYRVLFNDGATTLSVVTDLSSGDKLTKPATPVKDGYTFAGWYKDSACTQAWDFETGIPGSMTLYAKWTAAGSSGETEATATPTKTATAVTTPQPTKTQTAAATTSAPQATTAAGVSPTLTQAPAPVAGALFGLLAAGVLLRRRFQ